MRTNKAEEFPLSQECFQVIGCAMTVHNELSCGFLEPVCQEALGIELFERQIPYQKEKRLDVMYKGRMLDKKYC